MSEEATVAEVFQLAIEAEETAHALYRELAAKFAHLEEAAHFWEEYAADETAHARELKKLRREAGDEELTKPADRDVVESARRVSRFSAEKALEGMRDLEDAYELAHEIESSEINVVFDFLITNFALTEEAQDFLRSQLREHIRKITTGFPEEYGDPMSRRAIRLLE